MVVVSNLVAVSKIRDSVRSTTQISNNCDEKYMKIKFNSNKNLTLNKAIQVPSMIVVVIVVFLENNKYFPQVFLDKL